jgi:ribose transport system substrate-binding protein
MKENYVKRHIMSAVAVLGLLVTAACGTASDSSDGGGKKTEGTGEIGEGTVGILQFTAQSESILKWSKTAETALKDIGWQSTVVDGKGDPGVFSSAIEGFISQKVSGIILIGLNPAPVATALEHARDEGIPIIQAPNTIVGPKLDLYDGNYSPDDRISGKLTADYLLKKYPKGAKYTVMDLPANSAAHEAVAGAEPVLKKAGFENVGTVALDQTNLVVATQEAAINLVQGHPEAKILFSCCDFTPAITEAAIGKDHPEILQTARYDNLSSLDLIRKGANMALVTANADYAMLVAVDQILAHTVKGDPIDPKAAEGRFEYKIVDKDSLPPEGKFVFDPQQQIDEFVTKWKSEYDIK